MKLHNLCLTSDPVSYLYDGVEATDVSGGYMHEANMHMPTRVDHMQRARSVQTSVPLFTGPNKALAALELTGAGTDEQRKKAAELAMEPAWEKDEETSPRDPEYKAPGAVCHPRDKATALLRKPDARKQATDIMRIYQVRRKAKMHW